MHNDLRQDARNTTGIPADLINGQLGFRGSGRWIMQAVVDHTWRSLLAGVAVESGHDYTHYPRCLPLPSSPPQTSTSRFTTTGYVENDPSGWGAETASGTLNGAAVLSWECGGPGRTLLRHGAELHAPTRCMDASLPGEQR